MAKRKQETGGQDDRPQEDTATGVTAKPTVTLHYGLALEQFDALERSLRMIAAHGDLLATVQATDLAAGTLPAIGQAIHDEAQAMQAVLVRIGEQRLKRAADARGVVEEPRAGYGARGLRRAGGTMRSESRRSRRPAAHLHLVREGGAPVRH